MRISVYSVAALFLAVFFAAGAVFAADDDKFFDRSAGFSIKKPKSWTFLSMATIEENRERVKLNDEELEKRIKEKAALPLVAFVKHPEPYEHLNPSVQVVMSPIGNLADKSPVEILNLVKKTFEKAFAGFTILEDVKAVKVDGMDGAYFKASYKVSTNDGREFGTIARVYFVPRGLVAFSITMSGASEGEDVSDEQFTEILSTIKISR